MLRSASALTVVLLLAALAVAAFAAPAAADTILTWEATAAEKDATYGQYSGGHAFWLPDVKADLSGTVSLSDKWVFDGDGLFTETLTDLLVAKSATLTGTIYNTSNSNYRFDVTASFKNDSTFSPSAKRELRAKAYSDYTGTEGPGPIDPDDWRFYYLLEQVTLTGEDSLAGLELTLKHKPTNESMGFQVGEGANGKNLRMGMSGWFDYTVGGTSTYGLSAGKGDININVNPVPEPGTIALVGLGIAGLAGARRRRRRGRRS